ncbi:MAG: phosphoglycerate kinase [Candidatus Thermoplasmatota archaeon]|nr:phosphoglycerate kinase [Candidatus Thermoplasmatota archaeon]
MREYNTLDDFDVENKTVLLRVDFNLPLDKKTFEILDTTRIKLVLPTIQELIEKNAKIVILAHQGRKGSWDFISMEKHAKALQKLLGKEVKFVDDIYGEKATNAIKNLENKEILFLDNVRKFSEETEKKSAEEHAKSELVQSLYPLADIFVNDAFAAAHRAQCSLIGFTNVLPSCAGRLMEKELATLEKVVKNPEKPCIFLFGGAKFSDVIVTIEQVLANKTADKILLTGLPANAFLKAEGYNLGEKNESALLEEGKTEHFEEIKKVLATFSDDIYLPVDFAVSENEKRKEINLNDLPSDYNLFDIGEKTIEKFEEILTTAKTVFLSGPCGVFENPLFKKGTEKIFKFVADSEAFSIVGGGHTVAAVEQLSLREKISHISTGGGSLEKFMMGEKLVVVEALKEAKKKKIIEYS